MAEIDRFKPREDDAPAYDAYTITPSDTQNEVNEFRALYIGTAGDVSIYTLRERTTVFKNVQVGILAVSGKRVNASGTDAADIVGLL